MTVVEDEIKDVVQHEIFSMLFKAGITLAFVIMIFALGASYEASRFHAC